MSLDFDKIRADLRREFSLSKCRGLDVIVTLSQPSVDLFNNYLTRERIQYQPSTNIGDLYFFGITANQKTVETIANLDYVDQISLDNQVKYRG